MERNTKLLAGIALSFGLACLSPVGSTPLSAGVGPDAESYGEARASFEFDGTSESTATVLSAHGLDPVYGIPLTPDERDELDERQRLQAIVTDQELAKIKTLPGYAGFFFDHSNQGTPTILSTKVSSALESAAKELNPEVLEVIEIIPARYTYDELSDAFASLLEQKTEAGEAGLVTGHAAINYIAIDVMNNQLKVGLEPEHFDSSVLDLDVPATFVPFEEVAGDVCVSRNNCTPFRGGIRVTSSGGGSGTLGIGIVKSGDRQYTMAGHQSGSPYNHNGISIGASAGHTYVNGGYDARRIFAADSQVTGRIYLTASTYRTFTGSKFGSVGLNVCFSGVTSGAKCGAVFDDLSVYDITGGPQNLHGAGAHYGAASGDSGAPLYWISGSSSASAVGIHSASGQYFARWIDFSAAFGASLYIP